MRTPSNDRPIPALLRAILTIAVITTPLLTACSDRTDTTGLPPAEADKNPDVFLDGYAPGVTYQAFMDSKYDAVIIDANDAAVGTSSLQVTVPGPSVDPPWFAGGAFTNEWARDLSGYNAVTFFTKSERPTTLNEVGFGISFGTNRPTVEKYATSVAGTPMTTDWVKHVIPIPDPSKLTLEAGLFFFSEGYEGAGYTFWLDEIKFEQVGGISNPRPTMTSSTMSAFVGSEVVPTGTQVTFDVDGQDIVVKHAPGYFNYNSNDEAVVKVNTDGRIMVVGNGSAEITATLGTTPVVGSIAVSASTLPTQPAPTPTLPDSLVISIFSDAYTDIDVDKWMADWASGSFADMSIAGDPVKAYTSLGFAAIEFITNAVNADSMTYFHCDVWVPGGTNFIVKLVDFGADGRPGGIGDNKDSEQPVTLNAGTTPPFTPGNWVSLDIPMTSFTNGALSQTAHIAQLIFEGVNTVLVDNIYFHK